MEGMDFGTDKSDINAFENAAKHILEDEEGSMACLAAWNLDKSDLNELLAQLSGKALEDVLDSALHVEGSDMKGDKGRLYTLFGSAKGCIAKANPRCT